MGISKIASRLMVVLAVSFTLVAVFVVWGGNLRAAAEAPMDVETVSFPASNGYILRFDPVITHFEAITLPVVAGRSRQPEQVVAVGNEVWYTDPGADKIGRIVYTGTNNYALTEFSLPAGSEPFDMVTDSGYLWFTAKGGDWIGQVEISTTNIVSFSLAVGRAPWRIDVGTDGSVWFTERAANKLGHLVVTDTNDYLLTEYDIPQLLSSTNEYPEGLAVRGSKVWLGETAPANKTTIIQFDTLQLPPDDFVLYSLIPGQGYPVNLGLDAQGNLWMTELLGNNLTLIQQQTLGSTIQRAVPTKNSQPYDLIADSANDIWFTERLGHKLVRYNSQYGTFNEFVLPQTTPLLWLQGVMVDNQNNVWMTGFVPNNVYLPLILR